MGKPLKKLFDSLQKDTTKPEKITVGYYDDFGYEDTISIIATDFEDFRAKWLSFCRYENVRPHDAWGMKLCGNTNTKENCLTI